MPFSVGNSQSHIISYELKIRDWSGWNDLIRKVTLHSVTTDLWMLALELPIMHRWSYGISQKNPVIQYTVQVVTNVTPFFLAQCTMWWSIEEREEVVFGWSWSEFIPTHTTRQRRRHTLDWNIRAEGTSSAVRIFAIPTVSLASQGASFVSTSLAWGTSSDGARLRSYLSSLLIL